MAIHVIPNQAVVLKDDGTAHLYAWADTEAELSGVTEIDGYTVAGGSMVVAFDTGNILGYNSDSEWKNLTDPQADTRNLMLSSPKSAPNEQIRTEITESEVQEDAETDSSGSDESKIRSANK